MTRAAAAAALWTLLALFVLRVAGQVVAYLAAPAWLPPHRRWYSGVMPYRLLFPAQLLFVAVMAPVSWAVTVGSATLDGPSRAGVWVVALGVVYALGMTWRAASWLALPPERRGVVIPIVFHFVLAAWVLVYGAWLSRA